MKKDTRLLFLKNEVRSDLKRLKDLKEDEGVALIKKVNTDLEEIETLYCKEGTENSASRFVEISRLSLLPFSALRRKEKELDEIFITIKEVKERGSIMNSELSGQMEMLSALNSSSQRSEAKTKLAASTLQKIIEDFRLSTLNLFLLSLFLFLLFVFAIL